MITERDLLAEIPRLRRYARALTGDAGRADDLVQDTLERALGKWSLWRPGNLRAWLMTMMHNVLVNQLRGADPVEYREAADVPEFPVRARQTDGLELRDLDRALQALPAEQRMIVLLVGLEDMRYEEVAKLTGLPMGTVMSRLSRARARLRTLLAEGTQLPQYLKVVK